MTRLAFWILALIGSALPLEVGAQDAPADFERANQAYYENRPKEAIEIYQQLLKSGAVSGDLFYNLGNAYYRMGRIGPALLCYAKAARLIPRDADLRANRAFVEKKRIDAPIVPPLKTLIPEKLFFWSDFWTVEEGFAAFLAFFSLGWLFGILRLVRRSALTARLQAAFLLISVVLGASVWFKYARETISNRVILLKPEVPVHPTFLDPQTVLLTLHEGTELQVLSRQRFQADGNWMQVALPAGQKGWIRADAAGEI